MVMFTVITSKFGMQKPGFHTLKVQSFNGKPHKTFKLSQDSHQDNSGFVDLWKGYMAMSEWAGRKIEQLEKLSQQIAVEYKGWEHVDVTSMKNN